MSSNISKSYIIFEKILNKGIILKLKGAFSVEYPILSLYFKGMLRRKIEHFLKKRKFEKLGFSKIN